MTSGSFEATASLDTNLHAWAKFADGDTDFTVGYETSVAYEPLTLSATAPVLSASETA